MDRTLNLLNLYELLHNTLLITEEVKEILRRDCNQAAFVLKPWQMKTVVEKRIDESTCSCKKVWPIYLCTFVYNFYFGYVRIS